MSAGFGFPAFIQTEKLQVDQSEVSSGDWENDVGVIKM